MKSLALRDIAAQCASLDKIPNPEKLLALNIAQTRFGDAQAPILIRFPNQNKLIIMETSITDATIQSLMQMKSLKLIAMTQTDVTAGVVQRLRQALPDCTIK